MPKYIVIFNDASLTEVLYAREFAGTHCTERAKQCLDLLREQGHKAYYCYKDGFARHGHKHGTVCEFCHKNTGWICVASQDDDLLTYTEYWYCQECWDNHIIDSVEHQLAIELPVSEKQMERYHAAKERAAARELEEVKS